MQGQNPQLTAEELAAQERSDWKWFVEDERGRRIARRIRFWSNIDMPPPGGGIEAVAVENGMRAIGWRLIDELRRADPDGWLEVEREYLEELAWLRIRQAAADKAGAVGTSQGTTP